MAADMLSSAHLQDTLRRRTAENTAEAARRYQELLASDPAMRDELAVVQESAMRRAKQVRQQIADLEE